MTDASYWKLHAKIAETLQLQGEELQAAISDVARRQFRRRIAGFEQVRLGLEGYSTDLERVVRTHIAESVRYVGLDTMKYKAINLMERNGLSAARSAQQQQPELQRFMLAWLRDVNGQKQSVERSLDAMFDKPWATPIRTGLAAAGLTFLITGGLTANPVLPALISSYVGYRFWRAVGDEVGGDFKTRAPDGRDAGRHEPFEAGHVLQPDGRPS